jgi:hypothetical protein
VDANYVAVPLWLVQTIAGVAITGLLGAFGVGIKVVIEVGGLRQLLVGIDGKNGIRGDLQLLDARVENLEHDQGAVATQVAVLQEFKQAAAERLQGLEDRERHQAA